MKKAFNGLGTIRNIEDIRLRCVVCDGSGCWLWKGAVSSEDGTPRIWYFDATKQRMVTGNGRTVVWKLAHGEAPAAGQEVWRECGIHRCLFPGHLALRQRRSGMQQMHAEMRDPELASARRMLNAAATFLINPTAVVTPARQVVAPEVGA